MSASHTLLEVDALDAEAPRSLTVAVPPEEITLLPAEELRFDLTSLDSFSAWSRAHRILAATLVRETGVLSGACFGRVALEAYQLAPALRLLAKPRPSLLIADDVGLGKTIEAGLALLELLARRRIQRVLIVAPPGLLQQWREELLEKFGLAFTVIENAAGLAAVQTDLPAGVSPWDALPRVLTSVDYLKKETVRGRALRKRWDFVIVDEAHSLAESGTPQNPYRTQRTRLGLALREASRGLLLLTATPHNGYAHSFRSLLELVAPALATLHGTPEQVSRRVEAAAIRRMKAQIRRRLPDGREDRVFPEREVRCLPVGGATAAELELLRKVGSYCSKTARGAEGSEDADLVTFAMQVMKKRSLSSRRALEKTIETRLEGLKKEEVRETPPSASELRELQADLPLGETAAERTSRQLLRSAIPKEEKRRKAEVKALNGIRKLLRSLPGRDPKIEALLAELKAVFAAGPEEKIIVFTEYVDTLESIQERLDAEPDLAGRYVVLRGGLSPRQRLRRQERFEQPEVRLLLATDAASEGLNLLRSCRRVIHFELPWNPNRLEQRNGRVDRYGQTREPVIRYLFYAESPEEDVLSQLVTKIEAMRDNRLSTPDVRGAGEIETGLVELDPEAADLRERMKKLVRHFEDRTADFVRNVQPLVTGGGGKREEATLSELLNTAEPLLLEDEALEGIVAGILGPRGTRPTGDEGVYSIEVPLACRGSGVQAIYPRATFWRAVAVRQRASELEFITSIHPLVQSLAQDARRRLLQVYSSERGLPPRRLAARRVGAGEPPSVLFTFLGELRGGSGLIEEVLIPIRVALDGSIVGTPGENLVLLREPQAPGEIGEETLRDHFAGTFEEFARRAQEVARRAVEERARELREKRSSQTRMLLDDLAADLTDRLAEIDLEERRAKGTQEASGQLLFDFVEKDVSGYAARREAAKAQTAARRREIAEFGEVGAPGQPRPLGALFLVPEDQDLPSRPRGDRQ